MRIDDLSYSKGKSSKPVPEGPPGPRSDSVRDDVSPGTGAESTDYTKGSPYISTRILFILSGGSKREKDYFKPLKADDQIHSVKIAFRSKKGQGLKPNELKNLADDFMANRCFVTEDESSFHIEEDDMIFILQDVDEFSEDIRGHLKNNDPDSPCRWIISNPSFEIWLFYHYSDSPESLKHGASLSERDRSNWLKEYLNTLIPGGIKPTQIFYKANEAIVNSRKNYDEQNGFPALYSTQMHLVVESILDIMDSEFNQMKRRRDERAEYFRLMKLSNK